MEVIESRVRDWAASHAARALDETDPWTIVKRRRLRRRFLATLPFPSSVKSAREASLLARVAADVAAEYESRSSRSLFLTSALLGAAMGAAVATAMRLYAEAANAGQWIAATLVSLVVTAIAVLIVLVPALGDLGDTFHRAPVWRRRAKAYEMRAAELARLSPPPASGFPRWTRRSRREHKMGRD